jgi:hypothetical protein
VYNRVTGQTPLTARPCLPLKNSPPARFCLLGCRGLVQHRVLHAQGAAFQRQQGARLFEQVLDAEGLPVEESVGRIMGKGPAGHFGQAHSSPHSAALPRGAPCSAPGCILPSRVCSASRLQLLAQQVKEVLAGGPPGRPGATRVRAHRPPCAWARRLAARSERVGRHCLAKRSNAELTLDLRDPTV